MKTNSAIKCVWIVDGENLAMQSWFVLVLTGKSEILNLIM